MRVKILKMNNEKISLNILIVLLKDLYFYKWKMLYASIKTKSFDLLTFEKFEVVLRYTQHI